jgi:hypothetical protein
MKTKTKVNDIELMLALHEQHRILDVHKNKVKAELDSVLNSTDKTCTTLNTLVNNYLVSKKTVDQMKLSWKKIPAKRKSLADMTVNEALDIGKTAARMGSNYSGDVSYRCNIKNAAATAYTLTDEGEQYSRSCKYHKTNASHVVNLDVNTISYLVEQRNVRRLSVLEGLHLISLNPDGSCVWVECKAKQIVAVNGWIVWNDTLCYHSTKSVEDAQKGLDRKIRAFEKEEIERKKHIKESRRARLVAKLCKNVTATITDAKSMGYCDPGIRGFQQRFGIGDSATLNELLNTKDPYAVNLVLKVARKIKKTKKLTTQSNRI